MPAPGAKPKGGDGGSASDSPSPASPTSQGVQSYRTAARWLIASFGALGAALIASLQLKDLSSISGSEKTWAIWGFIIAMAGVLLALAAASSILAAQSMELQEIRDREYLNRYFAQRRDLLQGFESPTAIEAAFSTSYTDRRVAYEKQVAAWLAGHNDDEDKSKRQYLAATLNLDLVVPAADQLVDIGLFVKVSRRWRLVVLPGIVLGVIMATAGVGLFAVNDSGSATQTAQAVPETPTVAVLDLKPSMDSMYQPVLGSECRLSRIEVLVLGATATSWDLSTIDPHCDVERLSLPVGDGAITACASALPSLSSDPSTNITRLDDATSSTTESRAPPAPPINPGGKPFKIC